jgi:hypothetical protein
LRKGLKKENKNSYYRMDNVYIVKVCNNKYFIVDRTKEVRKILKKHIFNHYLYPKTNTKDGVKRYHQIFMNYEVGVIDHINRKKYDNRKENLRVVSRKQNQRNLSLRCDNKSGVQGVRHRKDKNRNCFEVSIYNDEKRITKTYSVRKYGYDRAKELAIKQRELWKCENGYLGE